MTTPQFTFAAPASGDWFTPSAHMGHLVLVKAVTEVDPNHWDKLKNNGQGGTTTKVTFDYVDLDDPQQLLVEGAQNSHAGVAGKLTRYVNTGQMILGRIGQAAASQPGRSAAYILEDASADPSAQARAGQWLTAYNARQFAPPQQTQAQAGMDPWAPAQLPQQQLAAYGQPQPQPQGNAAYQQAQTVYAATPGPILPPNTGPAGPPVVAGMAPEQVAQLQASGMDIAAIQQLAATLVAPQQ